MGDRTHVILTVLTKHADDVRVMRAGQYDEVDIGDGFTQFMFEEVNYAELDIEKDLRDARIPYDKDWEAGCEYGAGTEQFRVLPDGTTSLTECYREDSGIDIEVLQAILARDISDTEKVVEIETLVEEQSKGKVAPFSLKEQANYV